MAIESINQMNANGNALVIYILKTSKGTLQLSPHECRLPYLGHVCPLQPPQLKICKPRQSDRVSIHY